MTIKDLVVQIDQTPAAQVRLEAALVLAEHYEAHLTALFLIAEPLCAGRLRLSPACRYHP